MHRHTDRPGVQEAGCEVIWVLIFNTGNIRDKAGTLGLLSDVRAAMRAYPITAQVQEVGCGAICNLTANCEDNRVVAARLGLKSDVQKAMRNHPESKEVQLCGALALLAMGVSLG
jgi:hypothetical protein